MQYAEQYEIRIYRGNTLTETIPLTDAAEHQAWNTYDPIRQGLKSGERVELVRVSTVVLGQSAKA